MGRRRFGREFKIEAVRLLKDRGYGRNKLPVLYTARSIHFPFAHICPLPMLKTALHSADMQNRE